MTRLGFGLFLDPKVQAPIIATFVPPKTRAFDFSQFYDDLAERGFLIYPGKLTRAESFRIGCIGALDRADFLRLLQTIEAVLEPQGSLA